jgi:negative regulator of replication initiation
MIIAHINDNGDVTKGRIIAGGSITEITADVSYLIACLNAHLGEEQSDMFREWLKHMLELPMDHPIWEAAKKEGSATTVEMSTATEEGKKMAEAMRDHTWNKYAGQKE